MGLFTIAIINIQRHLALTVLLFSRMLNKWVSWTALCHVLS